MALDEPRVRRLQCGPEGSHLLHSPWSLFVTSQVQSAPCMALNPDPPIPFRVGIAVLGKG